MSKIASTVASIAALASAATTANANEAPAVTFQITGAYSFADTYDVMAPIDGVIARAGRLTGSWRLVDVASGASGNAHLNAATAVRIVPGETPSLMGTMELAMSEHHNSAPGSDVIWLAYEASGFEMRGPNTTVITVDGRVVGGRGRYVSATGDLRVVSINGFIDNGQLRVRLAR